MERGECGAKGRVISLRHLYFKRPDLAAAREDRVNTVLYSQRQTSAKVRTDARDQVRVPCFAQLLNLAVSRRETGQ